MGPVEPKVEIVDQGCEKVWDDVGENVESVHVHLLWTSQEDGRRCLGRPIGAPPVLLGQARNISMVHERASLHQLFLQES